MAPLVEVCREKDGIRREGIGQCPDIATESVAYKCVVHSAVNTAKRPAVINQSKPKRADLNYLRAQTRNLMEIQRINVAFEEIAMIFPAVIILQIRMAMGGCCGKDMKILTRTHHQ